MKKSDIQIDGRRVLIKKYDCTNPQHFTWCCIAEFHHVPEMTINPVAMARAFVRMLTEDQNALPRS